MEELKKDILNYLDLEIKNIQESPETLGVLGRTFMLPKIKEIKRTILHIMGEDKIYENTYDTNGVCMYCDGHLNIRHLDTGERLCQCRYCK